MVVGFPGKGVIEEEALPDLIHLQGACLHHPSHLQTSPSQALQEALSPWDIGVAGTCPGSRRVLVWSGGVESKEEGHTQPGSPDMLVFREHWPFFLFRFPSGDLALDGGKVGRITELSLGSPLFIQ